MFALVIGAVTVKAQSNDLFQGITQKFPYGQMVTPYGVQVTFAKTVHIIFPSTVKYGWGGKYYPCQSCYRRFSGRNQLFGYL